MKFPYKLFKSLAIYLYLTLSLWWNLVRVITYTNSYWTPKSFFHIVQEKQAYLEFSIFNTSLFESAFFSLVALPGLMTVTSGSGTSLSIIDDWRRYLWLCLIPWLITYVQAWMLNLCDFAWSIPTTVDATNFKMFSFLWGCQLIVQALLWSEVFFVALQGWMLMRTANREQYNDTIRRMVFSSGVVYGYNETNNTEVPTATPAKE